MKKLGIVFTVLAVWGLAGPAICAEFGFHGDMNNRFLIYTNHHDWLDSEQQGVLGDSNVNESYGELKYRFWFEAATDEGNVKGVYAIEIGGVRFGKTGTGRQEGGSFSGDGANVETRWAYLDFQWPFVESKLRSRVGLQPFAVNSFFWQETIAGFSTAGALGEVDYQLAWVRPVDDLARDDSEDDIKDVDAFLGRVDFKPTDGMRTGLFAIHITGDTAANNDPGDLESVSPRDYEVKQFADNVQIDLFTIGTDGSYAFGDFFINWDLMYQKGHFNDIAFDDSEFSGETREGDFDLSAYFLHGDLGYNMGKAKLTYTFWYASGDDDAGDNDFDGFLSVDVDRDDNLSIFEGLYVDDVTYFTERPYMLDKGFIMNKLALDYKATDKLTVGSAVMYMLTAEDIEYFDNDGDRQQNDEIGVELNGYVKYMLYKNVELAVNAGYLFAGDAMDAFEQGNQRDGDSDENVFASSARIRYQF